MLNQKDSSALTTTAMSRPTISKMVNHGFSAAAPAPVTTTTTTTTITPANPAAAAATPPSRKKTSLSMVLGGLILFLLVVGSGAALYLTQMNQDISRRAAEPYYRTVEFIIGGYPEQAVIDQFERCYLYDNPCQAGTGEDSVCVCPGYNPQITVGCNGGGSATMGQAKSSRAGKSLGCAPLPSPTPSPTPVGPMCLSVGVTNAETGAALTADPKFNDQVKFTCGEVAGVDHYVFRVTEPDGTIVPLAATGRTSANFTITKTGKYHAQCQVCANSSDSSCNPYESLN